MKIAVFILLLFIQRGISSESNNIFHPSRDKVIILEQWGWQEENSHIWKSPPGRDSVVAFHHHKAPWYRIPSAKPEIRWFQTTIKIGDPLPLGEHLILSFPAVLSAFEVYWEGVQIGVSGGMDGSSWSQLSYFCPVPSHLSKPGQYTLSLRVSGGRTPLSGILKPVSMGISTTISTRENRALGTAYTVAGIFFMTALFHLLVLTYPGGRRTPSTLFSIFSLSCAGMVVCEATIRYASISSAIFFPLAIIGEIFWYGIIILLPIYLLSHFQIKGRHIGGLIFSIVTAVAILTPRLALHGILPPALLPLDTFIKSLLGQISVIYGLSIVWLAKKEKMDGSRTIFSGMILLFLGLLLSSIFGIVNGWSIGFSLLNIFITIAVARQLSDQMREYHQAEIRAARLELELLKTHIQPHFLLNTLNSIVAWIEEEPKIAAKLVNTLSKELRLLMAFAGEKTIILSEEIKLCKLHLEIMNMRKETNLTLNCHIDNRDLSIPPMILHTIIENGVTHGFATIEEGCFTLLSSSRGEWQQISISNNGSNRGTASKNGTGSQYICRRLQEVYGEDWRFSSQPSESGWTTTIEWKPLK